VAQFEDFLNARILPLVDEGLAKFCVIKFVGLDAETPEKESVRLGQDMPIHMTYDEVLQKVEKTPVGVAWGGQIPLNPQYKQNLDALFTVGEILEHFCGIKDASKDPMLAYRRDPFWFQQVQIMMQQQQAQAQQAQAQQQAAQGGPPPDGGGGGGGQPPPQDPNGGGQPAPQQGQDQGPDLTTGLDQVIGLMSKSEAQLPPSRRRLLEQQRSTVTRALAHLEDDLKEAMAKIVDVADVLTPQKE
jgi:hypothetical protein